MSEGYLTYGEAGRIERYARSVRNACRWLGIPAPQCGVEHQLVLAALRHQRDPMHCAKTIMRLRGVLNTDSTVATTETPERERTP